jgi:ribosomal peptide maturation radical SAM protein 1
MSRVLLVNMPFSNLRWPNLGPSLLKAALARRGIGCEMAYFNFDFAERIGPDRYQWIADHFAFVLGGERLFALEYFAGRLPDDDAYWREVLLRGDPELSAADRADYESAAGHVGPFLDACVAAYDWSRYAVVGFAASFQQTLPSLCLASRIKRLRREIKVVFGGAACEAEMGVEIARRFAEVDYVCLGEADEAVPELAAQLVQGQLGLLPPGVVERSPDADRLPPACCDLPPAPDAERFLVRDLDAVPYPDFDDYFARLKRSGWRDRLEPLLFFETSRGCWWGQKRHCAFCGLNGSRLRFRSKSPRRALDELRHLVGRYGVRRACSADNILDPRYFDSLLPMLERSGIGLAFVYEMKTNLTRPQVEALLRAGLGAAQLGIETFSTPLLRQIGKGATALENLQALRWFSEAGIEVKWNLLYGFPGEDPDGYRAMAELLPSLYHLAPPLAVGRVRLDRFSPYFDDPAGHGMVCPRPSRAFRFVFPFPDDVLARLAYYYEFDYADRRHPEDYAGPILRAARTWQDLKGQVTLRYFDRGDGVLVLTDTRPGAEMLHRRLAGPDREIYLYCDTGRPLESVAGLAARHGGGADAALYAGRLKQRLDQWVADRIMACLDGRYLSLAVRAPG